MRRICSLIREREVLMAEDPSKVGSGSRCRGAELGSTQTGSLWIGRYHFLSALSHQHHIPSLFGSILRHIVCSKIAYSCLYLGVCCSYASWGIPMCDITLFLSRTLHAFDMSIAPGVSAQALYVYCNAICISPCSRNTILAVPHSDR